jgi:aspartokinase
MQVSYTRGMSIISLICNVQRTSEILERVFRVLGAQGVNVKMMSQVQCFSTCGSLSAATPLQRLQLW